MKQIYSYLMLLLSVVIASCSEEEVPKFAAERGINFLAWNAKKQQFEDDYKNLKSTVNFFPNYIKGMETVEAGLKLGVILEGTLNENDTPVKLKALAYEKYPQAEFIFPDAVIKAGEHQSAIEVKCKHPGQFETEYGAIVTFDYASCGVVPGTSERQQYLIKIKDATDWQFMRAKDEAEWNQKYAATLGKYGPVKVRFILAALGKHNYSLEKISVLYLLTKLQPSQGFKKEMNKLNAALKEYNDTHEKPLAEPDGSPVTFEPVTNK